MAGLVRAGCSSSATKVVWAGDRPSRLRCSKGIAKSQPDLAIRRLNKLNTTRFAVLDLDSGQLHLSWRAMDQAGFIRRRIVARTLMFGWTQNTTSMLENINAMGVFHLLYSHPAMRRPQGAMPLAPKPFETHPIEMSKFNAEPPSRRAKRSGKQYLCVFAPLR